MSEETDVFIDRKKGGEAEKTRATANSLGCEELLDFMLESAKDYSIFTTDAEGLVTSWNAGAERFFGYAAAEIIGRSGRILYTPEDRESGVPEQELQTAAAAGRAEDERWHLRKDGTRFWVSGMVRPRRNDAGVLQGFIKIGRDLTERKRAEDALRRRERELSDYVENATIGLHWVGGDGIIKWANRTEMELLGYAPEEYIGHHIKEFHADQEVIDNILRLTGDEALHDHEARMRCKDGSFRYVLINSNVFRENGEFVHTRCFTRDITERKQTQDDLRKAHDELERRVAERTAELAAINRSLQEKITERKIAENRLKIQHDVTAALAESASIEEVIPKVLHIICKGLSWQACEYWDCESDEVLLRRGSGWRTVENEFDEFVANRGVMTFKSGVGLPGSVWESAMPMWIEDLAADTVFGRAETADREGLKTALGFPVLSGEKVLGVMAFFSRARHRRDEEILRVLGAVGSEIGQFIERKRAENELKSKDAQLTEAQHIARLGNWTFDLRSRAVVWSDEMFDLMGCGLNEIIPTYEVYLNLIHPDDRAIVVAANKRMMRKRSGFRYEHRLLFADGTIRFIEANASGIANRAGKIVGVTGTVQDITERRLAEDKLRESEEWLRAIFDASRDGVVVEDNGIIAYTNKAQAVLFGYDAPEELLGKSITELIHPDSRELLSEYGAARLKGESRPTIYEFNGRRRDGSPMEIEASVSISAVGGKKYITTTTRDITERKKAEREIKTSERRYRALITASAQVVWLADSNGEADFPTPAWQELTGQSFEETREISWLDALHPESRENSIRLWREAVENKTIYEDEPTVRTSDGSYRIFQARAVPLFDDDGKIQEWIGMMTDITDRKLAEEKLARSEHELRTLFSSMSDVILHLDADGRYLKIAPTNPALLYKPSEAVIGKTMHEVFPAAVADMFLGYVRQSLSSEQPINVEYSLPIRGQEKWFYATSTRMSEDTVLWVARDITERKQAEKALIESEERLQQSQKMEAIGTLTGGVAHDFNNLLTVILGNTQLAGRKLASNDPVRDCLTEISDAGNRAAELTKKLLAFSRRQHLERRAVNINDSVVDIVKLLERIIGEDVEISVNYASGLPAVFADAGQIEQVVMNLAVNARDAMPSGGRLTIETANVELDENYCRRYPYVVPGKYVEISVGDTGIGMDEETKAKVFEPYFTTKEVGKGTGLGLSMAYGIVKQHDGHINLESAPGHGTTFKIYLPADAKAVEETAHPIPISFLGGTETILVAEDEKPLRILAKDTLEELGYTVLLAKDGAEAVEIFAANRERIDLFLSDVVMPRMGGSEAYERIREMGGERVPLIFMTGYSSETVQSRFVKPKTTAEELGATVIQKPYTLEELGRVVREVLDSKRKSSNI